MCLETKRSPEFKNEDVLPNNNFENLFLHAIS
jgi:hypothetical protein